MYVTAVLFFNMVSLHSHTLAVHKLLDSIGEVGVRLFTNRLFHFFSTAEPATTQCFVKWTKGIKVSPYEVGTVGWMFQNLELEVSN